MKSVLPTNTFILTAAMLLPVLSSANEHNPHVHGAAKLQIAIDGNTASIMLESPMESLVGFEHAPGNETEKASLAKLVAALEKPDTLFVFSPAAGCTSSSVKLESPLIVDETHKDKSEHEEKHAHEHKEHDDKQEKHSDLDGEFVFTCKAAEQLKGLTVNLFDVAANLQDLDVEVAGPDKQTAAELSSKTRSMNW